MRTFATSTLLPWISISKSWGSVQGPILSVSRTSVGKRDRVPGSRLPYHSKPPSIVTASCSPERERYPARTDVPLAPNSCFQPRCSTLRLESFAPAATRACRFVATRKFRGGTRRRTQEVSSSAGERPKAGGGRPRRREGRRRSIRPRSSCRRRERRPGQARLRRQRARGRFAFWIGGLCHPCSDVGGNRKKSASVENGVFLRGA